MSATPNSGYTFADWTENGTVVSLSANYTFTLNSNMNLIANFTANTVNETITLSASPSAGGTVSGGGTFASGSSQTVCATPNSGYTFADWTENGVVVSSSVCYTFTLNSNLNLVAIFTPTNATPVALVLVTNGNGTIQHGTWPKSLVIGKKYTVDALPKARNVFSNWVAGGSQSFVSNKASLTFTMSSGLVLEANFVTNVFLAAEGTYRGLFAPENTARQQSNSGSFSFNVTSSGALSGNLDLSGQSVPLSGNFGLGGAANIVSKPIHGIPSLTTTLQLDFTNQSVSGTVSGDTFTAELNGDRDVFSTSQPATDFAGQYTLIILGTSDSNVGPYGFSYGTVKVSSLGAITLAGSLADGMTISQSSVFSKDGYWPLYVNLYGGHGSLWGTNYFFDHTLTNASPLSWINTTNPAKNALYPTGFTNQAVSIVGSFYKTAEEPSLALTEGQVRLEAGGVPSITNQFTLTTKNALILTNASDTNKLKLTITKATGVISGSFVNPSNAKETIKVNGVILQGQTNAQGYFLGTNKESGAFLLGNP